MNRNHASNGQKQANHHRSSRESNQPIGTDHSSYRSGPINLMQFAQQHQPAGPETGGMSSFTMANAPTSLANLAQLGGITLLPIGDYNSISNSTTRTTPPDCNLPLIQTPPSHRTSSTHKNKKQTNQSSHNYNISPASGSKSIQTKTKPTPDEQVSRPFNISSIPSVQSLNQTSNDLMFRRNINVVDHSGIQFNNHTQSMSSANVGREPSDRAVQPKIHGSSHANGVQVIPISNSLTSLQQLSRSQQPPTNMDTLAALSDSMVHENNYVNVNGDANNISLIKLMAILNNPALTITAVGPKKQSNNNPIDDGPQSNNFFETFGKQLADDVGLKPDHQLPSRVANTSRSINTDTKLRLPRSAANLQIIHGSQMLESSGMAQLVSLGDTRSDSHPMRQSEQYHNDFKLDWLSNCNQDSRAIAETQVQYHDEPCEVDNSVSESADPTILSTSVRNLLMQQISQGTNKQQNKSAQLLRHIANQEQDNDDSRSRDHNQLPIIESAYIPIHHRVVKQISDDVKIPETKRTVSTSGLMKKKFKGPTKTSRYRLYVPGMDNGNLRHSRTNESRYYLNDIQIVNRRARKVHLSDRHAMLDSMMNLSDMKRRKKAPTEPDEIFINRSKRVMSKIDTMLERKKRRRFERISGRESPKNNSLEDQCAESECEWSSDDEAMDLDSIGIIRTQLPLEEIETQAKKDHFMSVGLVSRETKHIIETELCERKLNLITPIAFEELEQPAGDIHRFVDTIVKTNGEDVQLRVDSNIKRNDLPLLEGLNRNTSRLKMSYMNLLGLDKRSKRTTLYKVKPIENTIANVGKQQIDLNKTPREPLPEEQIRPRLDTQRQLFASIGHPVRSMPQTVLKLAPSNCRQILEIPDKSDYMKSLGLMAS